MSLPPVLEKLFGSGVKEVVTGFGDAIDKIDNSEDKLHIQSEYKKVLVALETKGIELDGMLLAKAADNVAAEIKGDSWLQRNWRPILVLMCIWIIFNNYVLTAYFRIPQVNLDENIWFVIKLSISGYGAERGLRKLGVDLTQIVKRK